MGRQHLLIHIDDFLAGTLNPGDRDRIEKYLEANPPEQAFVDRERELKNYLSGMTTPDPGENYWNELESSILKRTEAVPELKAKAGAPPITVAEISRYLVPLAAVLLLFVGSIAFSGLPALPQEQIAATGSGDPGFDRNTYYHEKFALNFELIGSTVLGPPGTLGRKLVLMEIIDGNN